MRLHLSDKTIYENLETAARNNSFLTTELRHRTLGKTTALIQFAKQRGYTVLVPNKTMVKHLINEHGYERIDCVNSLFLDGERNYVFDEGVTEEDIDRLTRIKGINIITGFMKSNRFYEPIVNVNPHLQITLDELDSVPKVSYKGAEIKLKQEIIFHWETDTDVHGGTTIEIEHVETGKRYPKSKRIEERIKSHIKY